MIIYYELKKMKTTINVMIKINTKHPVFKVLRNKPSLDLFPASLITSLVICLEGLIGKAHFGHFSALSDTSFLHSGQLISAI